MAHKLLLFIYFSEYDFLLYGGMIFYILLMFYIQVVYNYSFTGYTYKLVILFCAIYRNL